MKAEYYVKFLSAFLVKPPPIKLIDQYLTEDDKHIELCDFIGLNIKKEFNWCTSVSLIEAADSVYRDAISNGNI